MLNGEPIFRGETLLGLYVKENADAYEKSNLYTKIRKRDTVQGNRRQLRQLGP